MLIDLGFLGIFNKAIKYSNKVAMTLSDKFCVDRHRVNFLELVKNKLDITFANEQEMISLIEAKNFQDVVTFAKQIKKLIVITRGEKGAIAILGDKIIEVSVKTNLNIIDLTGAGDLFASGFLFGFSNKLTLNDCGKLATTGASHIIQQYGARPLESLSKFADT